MSADANQSLQKIAKGGSITLIGTIINLLFAFLGRVLVARIGSEADYGVFSLCFVIINVCALIGALGLQQGAARSIAYARGENNIERIKEIISVSVQFGLLASVALSAIIFFTSDFIAVKILVPFHHMWNFTSTL